ncbi:MAG: ribosome maturation factor RimP [Pseudomonadota bacterium]
MTSKRDLKTLLEPAVGVLGFELWGIEYLVRGRHRLLRIYIDGPEGVTVDDCAAVSHQVSGVLDVEDPIDGEYTLEVSSPGLDRVLFEPAQYARYVGGLLVLRLQAPVSGRRRFRGRLVSVNDDGVVLALDDGGEQVFAFAGIDKAQIEPEFPNNKR